MHRLQSAREREAALVRIVSWNLQHGVPDPVGPPALGRAVPELRGRWRRRLRASRSSTAAAWRTAVRGTRAPCSAEALGGELRVGAGQALAAGRAQAQRARRARRGARARGRGPAGRGRAAGGRGRVGRGRAASAGRWRPPTCRSTRGGPPPAARRRSSALGERPSRGCCSATSTCARPRWRRSPRRPATTCWTAPSPSTPAPGRTAASTTSCVNGRGRDRQRRRPSCPCSDHLAVWADLRHVSYRRSASPLA